jgi:beta-N-acetylhexosaminidase
MLYSMTSSYSGVSMRYELLVGRRYKFAYSHVLCLVCCLAFLCSGCATSASSPTTHVRVTPVPTRDTITPTATESAEAILARQQAAEVRKLVSGMSLEQKLGQLLLVEYIGQDYQDSGLQEMISQQFVGGFMYQESNHNFDPPYNQTSKVLTFSQQAMQDARLPLLIATDQEGGLVNRLRTFHGDLPSAEEIAASGDPQMALQQGTQAAKWLRELGMNADLAPVVDVHTVDPPILEARMFGRDPQTVATYAGAFLQGLQTNTVAGCLKHFPGLGAITSDPHDGLPTVNRSMTELEKIDLAPYKLLIQQEHPAMIMSTDVLVPAIDPNLPAELSPKAIDGVLRGELGFDGVVITDGLYMQGISDQWPLSEAAVLAIAAGNDIIEGPFTPAQVADVVAAFKQAIQQGRISIQRIDTSVQRILLMKARYGILTL